MCASICVMQHNNEKDQFENTDRILTFYDAQQGNKTNVSECG